MIEIWLMLGVIIFGEKLRSFSKCLVDEEKELSYCCVLMFKKLFSRLLQHENNL